MIKRLLIPLLVFTSLQANNIDDKELNSIYIEAILFVTVFSLMSIASIFISKRHAKENGLKASLKREEELQKTSQPNTPKKTPRVKELSKMLDDGLITNEEFQTLKLASK